LSDCKPPSDAGIVATSARLATFSASCTEVTPGDGPQDVAAQPSDATASAGASNTGNAQPVLNWAIGELLGELTGSDSYNVTRHFQGLDVQVEAQAAAAPIIVATGTSETRAAAAERIGAVCKAPARQEAQRRCAACYFCLYFKIGAPFRYPVTQIHASFCGHLCASPRSQSIEISLYIPTFSAIATSLHRHFLL